MAVISAAVSGAQKTLGNAKESYGEALRALRESVSHVVHITDIPSRQEDVDGEYPKEAGKQLLRAGTEGGQRRGRCLRGRAVFVYAGKV